jgi:hypothetical protein
MNGAHKHSLCQSLLTLSQLFRYSGQYNAETAVHIVSSQRSSPAVSPQPWLRLGRQLAAILGSLLILTLLAPASSAREVTLAELRADPKLTPERLMGYFSDFKFELGRRVRERDAFLAKRAGDCDDFATLAADLLREKGYSTRLVVVFMPQTVHVVCYVAENHSYLDFNRRKEAAPLVPCKEDLEAIAASVAKSFRLPWHTASEFTFRNGTRRFVSTTFR